MTREREIERVLETWLRDGPSEMPDRVLDAVVDRVDRQPQRPLAQAQLRFHDMHPALRVAAVAAVLLVTLGAGLILGGGGLGIRTATPSPPSPSSAAVATASPTSSLAATSRPPDALVGKWISPPHELPALQPGIPSTQLVTVGVDGTVLVQIDVGGEVFVGHLDASDREGALTITSQTWANDGQARVLCPQGSSGTYTWSVDTAGSLHLFVMRDDCRARAQVLAGSWTRVGCVEGAGACLGALAAGTYESHVFDPRRPSDGSGRTGGAYGALRYTVPDGWANSADWPVVFALIPSTDYATATATSPPSAPAHGIWVFPDTTMAIQDTSCSYAEDPKAGRDLYGLSVALSRRGGLQVQSAGVFMIGGHEAQLYDLAVKPDWTFVCPGDTRPAVPLFTSAITTPGDDWHWGIAAGERMRVALVDLTDGGQRPGGILLIAIDDDSTPSRFAELVQQAKPIVMSFQFP